MLHEISDERYCFIEDTICDAFLLVLKEKGIEKITVTDIIKRAGIVRSTFYNHYENIPALITAVEDKTIQDIFTLMEDFHPENNQDICKSFFLTICNYTKTNPFLANILRSPRGVNYVPSLCNRCHPENNAFHALQRRGLIYDRMQHWQYLGCSP